MCILNLQVQSDYYDEDEKVSKTGISRYDLTRLTPRAMDIQIEFVQPESITVNK